MLPLVTAFLFIVWPFAAIVPVLWGVYQRQKWAYYSLALWLAFYSVYFIPSGDQFRFHQIFTGFPDVDWDLFNSQPLHYYSLVYVVMYFVRALGLNFEIMRLIWVLLGYSIYFSVWLDVCRKRDDGYDQNQGEEFLLFGCYVFSISLFDLALGFRSAMACALAVSSCYRFYFKKEFGVAFAMATLAMLIHFQFGIIFIVFAWLSFGRLNTRQLIWGVLLAFICGEWIFSGMLNNALSNASDQLSYLSEYVSDDGFWKSGVKETFSGIHLLFDYFLKVAKVLIVAIYIWMSETCSEEQKNTWRHLVYATIIVWALTFSYVTISGRVFMFLLPLMIIDIARNRKHGLSQGSMAMLFVLLSFLYAVNWASWRKHRAYSEESHFLYNDIYTLLTHTYDDDFINANIDDGGHLIGEGAPK